jgi:hypothetical protein
MAFSPAVEMTTSEDLSAAARMMSQAKLGTIRTPKIRDMNRHKEVSKSAKAGVHQSRMIRNHPVEYPQPISSSSPLGSISV